VALDPFGLSLSKALIFLMRGSKKEEGFDKLSPNGESESPG
jgi:hypothetical protein